MQIQGAQISMGAQYRFQRQESETRYQQQRLVEPAPAVASPAPAPATAIAAALSAPATPPDIAAPDGSEEESLEQQLDSRLALLKALVEAMTGRRIETPQFEADAENSDSQPDPGATAPSSADTPIDNRRVETLQVTQRRISESEYSEVAITGTVSGPDGSNLEISLSVVMARQFELNTTTLERFERPLTDPLVINLGGQPASLSASTTLFDLDSDGEQERLASLQGGSRYLARDSNGDGRINDGRELFGPETGNGFAELARFDLDGNGFIDADDPIYTQLYTFDPSDKRLQSLADSGVSALYTRAVDSPFSLKDDQQQLLGQIRSTSFYLDDQGQPGSVQQLDLVV